VSERILKGTDKTLGSLSPDRFAKAFPGMAESNPQDVGLVSSAVIPNDPGTSPEVNLGFLSRWKFDPAERKRGFSA
jgi:hypothetical protein